MCGICGFYNIYSKDEAPDSYTLDRMTDVLQHRGPDDRSNYLTSRIGLGFTRLSLLDLEHGSQPFFNENKTIVAICNGEIYNFAELRNDLESQGHLLHTHCDMEIIPHLYEQYGINFVKQLNGQFAIALYDSNSEAVFLIRDQMGICPLFYTIKNNDLIFGSEIKSILQYPSVDRKVDLVAMDQLITFPGIIAPRTLFEGISSLENGHYLRIQNGEVKLVQFWDLIYPKLNEKKELRSEEKYIEELDQLFTQSVSRRLIADAPVGLYVSGGLDSSIIAAKAAQINTDTRKSFSITFSEKKINEEKYQRLVAEHIGSNHYEYEFNISDITEQLRTAVWHSETALKETYNTASLMLSKLVKREGVKAVLTGEGADELFAGYVGYRFDKFNTKQGARSVSKEEAAIRDELWGDPSFFYEQNYSDLEESKRKLYSDKIIHSFNSFNCLNHPVIVKERIANVDLVHKRSYIDFKLRLPEHLLAGHGDRMAYANSVEARYPFLDAELVDYAVQELPPNLKLKGFNEKYILKKVAEKLIPSSIIKRPKFAFVAPSSPDLVKGGDEYLSDLLSYDRIRKQGYFNPDFVQQLVKQYSHPDFILNVPYEKDLLILVITFCVFLEVFDMPDI